MFGIVTESNHAGSGWRRVWRVISRRGIWVDAPSSNAISSRKSWNAAVTSFSNDCISLSKKTWAEGRTRQKNKRQFLNFTLSKEPARLQASRDPLCMLRKTREIKVVCSYHFVKTSKIPSQENTSQEIPTVFNELENMWIFNEYLCSKVSEPLNAGVCVCVWEGAQLCSCHFVKVSKLPSEETMQHEIPTNFNELEIRGFLKSVCALKSPSH